jgi:hypothetical protein
MGFEVFTMIPMWGSIRLGLIGQEFELKSRLELEIYTQH